MLWKCEMCQEFEFPEPDEDGNVTMWCNNPKVICIFMNFVRKYKCKYYRKILYTRLLKQCNNEVSEIGRLSWYYRDMRKGKTKWFTIARMSRAINHYLELRNYLFTLTITQKEIDQINADIKDLKEKIKKREADKKTSRHEKDIIEFDIEILNYKLNKLNTTYKNILKIEIA